MLLRAVSLRLVLPALVALAALLTLGTAQLRVTPPDAPASSELGRSLGGNPPSPIAVADDARPAGALDVVVERRESWPTGTEVSAVDGSWRASFTDGAATVALTGPERTFAERSATADVTTDAWVRLLPAPFDGEVDLSWLEAAVEDRSDDVLAVLTQYWAGAPDVVDADGLLVSAEAAYGPRRPDGFRPVGSDWHDFRGIDVDYPGERLDRADPAEFRSLDCSGYVREVFGARLGMSLSLRPDGGTSIPRRSFEQAAAAPGVVPLSDGDLDGSALQAGDLVFFDLDAGSDRIDHVGVFLGEDEDGRLRFVHSRRSANGPTMGGDDRGASVLDGDGAFAEGFVSTRRL